MLPSDKHFLEKVIADLQGKVDDKLIKQIKAEMTNILALKGEDYSTGGSTWINFARASAILAKTVPDVLLTMAVIKIGRLNSLLQAQQTPNYEGLDDSCIDAANYMVLLAAWLRRQQKETE